MTKQPDIEAQNILRRVTIAQLEPLFGGHLCVRGPNLLLRPFASYVLGTELWEWTRK